MNKHTVSWVYICDPPQDSSDSKEGKLYVARANPESLRKDSITGWLNIGIRAYWYPVDRSNFRVMCDDDDDEMNLRDPDCVLHLAEALLLDLSDVPVPKFDDEKPIIVVQTIIQSVNYYTEE